MHVVAGKNTNYSKDIIHNFITFDDEIVGDYKLLLTLFLLFLYLK